MTRNIPLFLICFIFIGNNMDAAEQAAVVMDKDGKVKHLIVQPGPVTVNDLKESFHEIGGADPAFVPPREMAISEPLPQFAAPETLKLANEIKTVQTKPIIVEPLTPVSTLEFSGLTIPHVSTVTEPEPPIPQPLYEPNQNGVIVLPGRSRASSEEGIANPFDIRLIAAKAVNEVKIRVGGVVMGDRRPTAIINGRPYSANDRWNGFNVVRVRRDSLLMERDGVFVLIPRGRDIAIKIPL
jgi:hypothetical protein